MALAFDATSNSGSQSGVSSFSWSHTCTGTNLVLIVGVGMEDLTDADRVISSITYNGVSLTKIRSDDDTTNNITTDLWYLINPTTGANTILVTMNAGTISTTLGGAVSFSGADQTSPIEANTGTTGTADPATLSVTTITDNAWVLATIFSSTLNTMTVTGVQTSRWNVDTGLFLAGGGTFGPQSPAGSVSMSWDFVGIFAQSWTMSGCSIKESSGAPPAGIVKRLMVLGVGT